MVISRDRFAKFDVKSTQKQFKSCKYTLNSELFEQCDVIIENLTVNHDEKNLAMP